MNAREYFALLDAITEAPNLEQLTELETRLAATALRPVERRALERVARRRALAIAVIAERPTSGPLPREKPRES